MTLTRTAVAAKSPPGNTPAHRARHHTGHGGDAEKRHGAVSVVELTFSEAEAHERCKNDCGTTHFKTNLLNYSWKSQEKPSSLLCSVRVSLSDKAHGLTRPPTSLLP